MERSLFVQRGKDLSPIPDIGFSEFIIQKLGRGRDEIALISGETDVTTTFDQFIQQIYVCVNILRSFGYQKGDFLMIYSNNRTEYYVPMIAALYHGIIVVPINFEYKKDELVHCMSITKPKIIFCTEESKKNLLEILHRTSFVQRIVVFDSQKKSDTLISPIDDYPQPRKVRIHSYKLLIEIFKRYKIKPAPAKLDYHNDIAFVFCSSGTTGLPKGVMLTHRAVTAGYLVFKETPILRSGIPEVVAVFLPLFHVFGCLHTLYGLMENMKSIIMPRFDLERFYQLIEKYRVTFSAVVPTICVRINSSTIQKKYDLSSLDTFLCGASQISKQTQVDMQKRLMLPKFRQSYGLTEVSLGIISASANTSEIKHGSVGRCSPNVSIKVIDLNTKTLLGPNQEGELCVRTETMMKGYYNNPEATAEAIDKDGWLHTGDVGYFDCEDYFYLVGRVKEMIKCNGFQVSPTELELLIMTYPGIKDVGVVGIPDARCGEVPFAFVVRNNLEVTEIGIMRYVKEQVSRQKHLRRVIFVDEIPKNSTGKIIRGTLRELLTPKSSL